MISADTLRQTFSRLKAAGLRPPVDLADRAAVATLADLWGEQWRDRSDEDMALACRAFLAEPRQWWPSPGHLLALAPKRAPRQLEARTPLARAEQRMGMVTSAAYQADPTGATSNALVDQAATDTLGACGDDRCIGVECLPCVEAMAERLEQLWGQRAQEVA